MMDPLCSEICWSTFKYFIILIVSIYYILSSSLIIKCLKISCICENPMETIRKSASEDLGIF